MRGLLQYRRETDGEGLTELQAPLERRRSAHVVEGRREQGHEQFEHQDDEQHGTV